MRILQLCHKPPFPATDGGTLAMHSATLGFLQNGNTVKVLCIETDKHPFQAEKIPAIYKAQTKVEAIYLDTEVKSIPALLNLFSSSSYNVQRFYSPAFEKRLREILSEGTFDIVHLESLFITPYIDAIRQYSKAKIVLRAHNVEHVLWQRKAELEPSVLKKKWFYSLAKKLQRYEIAVLKKVDAIVPITPEDAAAFTTLLNGEKKPVHVLPYAMDLPEENPNNSVRPKTVFHIGAMDWSPNVKGVSWLVSKIWPKVLEEVPGAELHLAGKQLQKGDLAYAGTNIFNHGEVENAISFMSTYAVMAAPLLDGGGMRVKLVEAMALGKAIVSTQIGAEGTGCENEQQMLLADTEETFAKALIRLLNDETLGRALGQRAKDFAKSHFSLVAASGKLNDFYTSLLK